MTRDDIIRMAREAGMRVEDGGWILCGPPSAPEMELPALERFAALVADAERERCAKACDEYSSDKFDQYKGRGKWTGCIGEGRADPHYQWLSMGADDCADSIRALKDGASEEGQGG